MDATPDRAASAEPDPDALQVIEIGRHQSGLRLDRVLAAELELSRAAVRRLLESGAVAVADRDESVARPVRESEKGRPLFAGERIEVEAFTHDRDAEVAPAPELALRVLGEGEGWICVDKPAGLPVHPLRAGEGATALGFVRHLRPEIHGVGEAGLRSGVVHRLDVDTSGALLFADREEVWHELRAAFSEHRMQKTYRALVAGRFDGPREMEAQLAVGRHRPARVKVVEAGDKGARAISQSLEALEVFEDASLVEIRPRTGFLHQIRVTLAHLGNALLGDASYASEEVAARAPRHMLHAAALRYDSLGIDLRCEDAEDFSAAIRGERGEGT